MPASIAIRLPAASSGDSAELRRQARLVQDAFARGQAALAAGERAEAARWLDRAHRLAPDDGTITLFLASAALGVDNPKAAALFAEVLACDDVHAARFGLASARFLMGDLGGACAAVAETLGRHVVSPDIADLAEQVAKASDAPGWCGLASGGRVIVHAHGPERVEIRLDGRKPPLLSRVRGIPSRTGPPTSRHDLVSLGRDPASQPPGRAGSGQNRPRHGQARPAHFRQRDQAIGVPPDQDGETHGAWPGDTGGLVLPAAWPQAGSVTVTIGDRHLLGSPIFLSAIGRVEGSVEASAGGLLGWAWCPGDPEADPRLVVELGRAREEIPTIEATEAVPGLPPLARPRSFAIPWPEFGAADQPMHLRGRDGRDLLGGPVAPFRATRQSIRQSRQRTGGEPSAPPASVNTPEPPVPARRRADLARWRREATAAVVLVTHDDGGGVERCVQASVAAHAVLGRRAIVLRPVKSPAGRAGVVVASGTLPNLRFELPRERPGLLRLFRAITPVKAELHHFLNHDPSVFETIRALGVPYDAHTHDYAWFCPRIALVGRGDRYCGEPAPTACQTCVTKLGGYLHEDISVPALLDRSRNILAGATRVIAPSGDAAARMTRHFPAVWPIVVPHEDDASVDEPPPPPGVAGMVRVCVAGAIGLHKGYYVLLACARDAKRRALPLSFVVVGTTIDDQKLINTGRIFVTGPYQPNEAVALIRAQGAALALLPSIWPETWCLGLTELWRAGLRVAAFDIGAPAERIRRTGRGVILPLGLSPPRINDALLNAASGRSFLPIRRSSAYKPLPSMQP